MESHRSLDKYRREADSRRINSLLEKKKEYNHQKNAIQAALSYKNMTKSNKIIFDQNEENTIEPIVTSKSNINIIKKTTLFDNENDLASDEDLNAIFELGEKFQGKAGEQLLKLQSTFKNDKRFRLDDKFLEDDIQNETKVIEDLGNIDIEEEKKKEYEILGQVLGREIKSYHESNEKHVRTQNKIKGMRRYDPSNPDHAQYEREMNDKPAKKRKKENLNNEKQVENKEEPEVSKETFYTVRDDLKKSLEEDKGFSLLGTFGMSYDEADDVHAENNIIPIEKKKYISEDPFRYESSDDEDQTEQLSKKEHSSNKGPNTIKAWTEPFFFQEDDYRLQEGVDFMKRLATEKKNDFQEIRKQLKEIARNKVRKNIRNNRPFKKKLGGSRKKKVKRINKALKR